ncbi:AAA family ATPase [Rhodococcus opacus]|uniref:AAA family ATPase n=1 Tax=Rhodococcus opacus TaxID=37919 RepID=A0A2S8JAT3_RHOOP|nr:ATP-binding protein [Rhodococcus opacus]PQP24138.1 AAA family ATPase [Rhodococcus opacus]
MNDFTPNTSIQNGPTMSDDSTPTPDEYADPSDRRWVTMSEMPLSVRRVTEAVQTKGGSGLAHYVDDHADTDEVTIEFEVCPVCLDNPLRLTHLGSFSGGFTEMTCQGCDAFSDNKIAEGLGLTPDDLVDIDLDDIAANWQDEPTEESAAEAAKEPSAAGQATPTMPVFDHPNSVVRDKAREMWIRDEAKAVVDKQRGSIGKVSVDDLRARMKSGAQFILDRPEGIPALLGDGQRVLWAEGEGFLITGPQGVGKTTFAGELLLGLVGLQSTVLGLTIKPAKRVLYLAMDRPQQIQRSLGRLFGEKHRDLLEDRVVVWPGPPIEDMAQNTDLLTQLAEAADADVVFVDSLKDAALGLSEDTVGAGWNRAQQTLLQSGRNIATLHHIKKAIEGDNPTINDVYGSTWITSGCGSVVMVSGKPGDPLVKFNHLKTPAEEVGPFTLFHDQPAGTIRIHGQVDLVALASPPEGLTAKAAAVALYEDPTPTSSAVEKARRLLDKAVSDGKLHCPEVAPRQPKVYFAKASR